MRIVINKLLPQSTINLEAGEHLENFFVSAVFSIFAIRAFLSLTDYPQIETGGLHIAHMLWGGFLMMIATIILLSFLSRGVKFISSIIGGLGFGIFIDELGKFITSDNNYFFQPAIALIYLIFILLFFTFRSIGKYITTSDKDYIINALELLKEVVHCDLDKEEKRRALLYLNKCSEKYPMVRHLKETIEAIKPKPVSEKHLFIKIKLFLHKIFLSLVNNKYFAKLLAWFFVFISIINIFSTLAVLRTLKNRLSFWDCGQFISTLSIGVIVMLGVYRQRKHNNLSAYKLFKRAIMIDIFLGQFFLFYREGLSSYLHLLISITIFFSLQYLISQEKLIQKI